MDDKARIVIPGKVREKGGIKIGHDLILEVEGNEIVLSPYNMEATENSKKDDLKDFLNR